MLPQSLWTRLAVFTALVGALFVLPLSPVQADTASDIKALQSAVKTLQSQVSTLQSQNTSLQSQVNALKSVTKGLSRVSDPTRTDGLKGTELYITGMNLHVVNGLGATNGDPKNTGITQVNGLGNIVVGYNKTRGSGQDDHSGSHNIIVGDENNFSSFGGLDVGIGNTISGRYASVSGGDTNTASGFFSSVSGGSSNTASGTESSVSGGEYNTASNGFASISGGYFNKASYFFSSVSGGYDNTASGQYASVSGGYIRTASGIYDWVAGGYFQDQ